MPAAWKNIFKKKSKLRQLNLQQIVDVWKICKPFVGETFEPYLVAEKVYTVSREKSNKLYRLFYGMPCGFLDQEVEICLAISMGFIHTRFEDFVQILQRD